ncbi:vWA domain-containing protein [Sphaerisporangium aureirubrum]|uniref:VWA domain-containing protein n=1 Tax=Sphaerisporangium aureirubrum TaxID=1544736 RepID=A0ABW1NED3_9ACTN
MSAAIAIPIYIVCDVSASMATLISELNSGNQEILDAIHQDPLLVESIYVALVSFADEARLEAPLQSARDVSEFPVLTSRRGTSYGAALRLLQELVARDIPNLKRSKSRVYRPLVFFFTDGEPLDDSHLVQKALEKLRNSPYRPSIVAVGMGEVSPESIEMIASRSAFLIRSDVTPREGVRGFYQLITATLNSFLDSIDSKGSSPFRAAVPASLTPVDLDSWL